MVKKIIIVSVSLILIGFFLQSTEIEYNQSDTIFFRKIYLQVQNGVPLENKEIHKNYISELNFIKGVSNSVFKYGDFEGLPLSIERSVENFFKYKKGLCYDRTILLERVFKLYGFKAKHIYIGWNNSYFEILFSRSSISHAMLEIETKKGNIYLDPNTDFMSVDYKNDPIQDFLIKMKKHNLSNISSPWWFVYFKTYKKCLVLRGFYSRHGYFIKPYNMLPDYNLKDLKIY